MGTQSGNQTTSQTTEPPAFIRPYLQDAAEQARALYHTGGPSYYQGNTVVPFAPQTEQAMGLTEQRALSGSPVTRAAQNYVTSNLNSPITSQFGQQNPYLESTFQSAAQGTRAALDSQFARSGRNLEAQMPARIEQLNSLAQGIYGGAYENDMNRQLSDIQSQRQTRMAMLGFAPQLANQDYVDLEALQGVGNQVEDLSGRLMEDQMARWDFQQNRPQMNLDNYIARITGAYPGQTSTQSTPIYRNRTAGAAGGALAGAAAGSQVYPGWGTLIGGLVGAAGGYYGS